MLRVTLRRLVTLVVIVSALLGGAFPSGASAGLPGGSASANRTTGQRTELPSVAGEAMAAAELTARPADLPSGVGPGQDGSTNYPPYDSRYHNYPEMVTHIHAVEAAHPGIVKVFSIGKSYQGRDLWAAEVSGDVTSTAREPEVMFDGLHHAREHLSAEMSIYVLDLLAINYGQATALGQRVTNILDTRRIWIVFMVNPDGLQFDISGPPAHPYLSWRKNRQPNPGSAYVGTDLNRNYGYDWGCCNGSSTNPGVETYRGPAAWSAPETRAIRDFVLSRVIGGVQQIRAHITFHTAGNQILWPYGYTYADIPPDMTAVDHRAFVALGTTMAASNHYTAEQSSDLYVTDGDQIDWMYGTQRIFSFTFEMFPGPNDLYLGSRWYPPDEMIAKLTAVNRDAVLYLMEQADCPYRSIGKAAEYCGPYYDDLEINRGWTVNPAGTDTATQGAWMRGIPVIHPYQLAAWDGQSALVTGLKGADVDGGRTTARSPLISLPATASTLHLHYWVGMDASAAAADSFVVGLVNSAGVPVATAISIQGNGHDIAPSWTALNFAIPAGLRGTDVAIELQATDGAADSTVEAGVDSVRLTTP